MALSSSSTLNKTLHSLQIGQEWDSTGLGGSDRVFCELANHLPTENVLFTGVVAGSADLAARTGGMIHSLGPLEAGTLARVRGAQRIIRELCQNSTVDLVATHFALYAFRSIDVISKRAHVVHFHGPWSAESLAEGRSRIAAAAMHVVERAVYNSADRVIVLSKAFAEVAVRNYKISEEKIRVVPGSVDVPRFAISTTREEARAELGWPQDRQILIAVRRLSARMGLQRLISAIKPVATRYPDTLLYIAGKGHMLKALQEQVIELKLEKNVVFLGFLPDAQLPLAYCAANLNIVPTLAWEGFGLVAAEALATGTPSLVTPIGGLPEVVEKLSPNLLFASAESFDIAQGVIEALSGQRKMPTRKACQQYAASMFASTTMAHRTAMVYREVVSGTSISEQTSVEMKPCGIA